jgi:hypothetical protein
MYQAHPPFVESERSLQAKLLAWYAHHALRGQPFCPASSPSIGRQHKETKTKTTTETEDDGRLLI